MRTLKHLGVALVAASSLISSLISNSAFAAEPPAPSPTPAGSGGTGGAPTGPGVSAPPSVEQPTGPGVTASAPDQGGISVQLTPENTADKTTRPVDEQKKEEKKLAWRNSTLLFDQSMSTQTAQLEGGSPQLSYVPVYEWWISFRPRYYATDNLVFSARLDYYKDMTNSEQTTLLHEDVFGDTWINATYQLPKLDKHTKEYVGVRTLFPTSKISQGQGIYVQAGVTGRISREIPIKGDDAKWLNSAKVDVAAWYNHPFTNSTTPTNYGDFTYERQDLDGHSVESTQLGGSNITAHQLLANVSGSLNITPKWELDLDAIIINQWKYLPTGNVSIPIESGGTTAFVPRNGNATAFVQQTWMIASISYDVLDELQLSLGYYNLANLIAPDGLRRSVAGSDNIWWSPDARVFFDVTANLDKIYLWATGQKTKDSSKKDARLNRETNHILGTSLQ